MLHTTMVTCPYCGERFETVVDCSYAEQRYVEDCYVCCRPIDFSVFVDAMAEDPVSVTTRRDDE